MKKIFAIMGMAAAAALAFTSCQKDAISNNEETIQAPSKTGVPFVIHVNPETKTTNDGLHTNWAANDSITVFHEDVADEGTYIPSAASGDAFTITSENLDSKDFTGTLGTALESGRSYNWYAMYPYHAGIRTPANTTSGYVTVGSASNKAQTQTGNNSMGHIQGKNYPLIGVANNVADDATPSITMSNASALIEVTVTNSLGEDLTVTGVSLESSDSVLVGTFYIDFSGNPAAPSFTPSGAGYVSKTANLNVESGAAIADGNTAKFYLAIKPYTMLSGQTLNVTVHGTTSSGSGTQVKEISSGSPVVFHAGKIKKIAVNYNTAMETIINWNLAVNQTSTVTENSISWSSTPVSLAVDKHDATTATNSYYGGDASNHTSTRFYKNSMMTITPSSGKAINKIVFTATSDSYASALANSEWTNATAVKDGTTVTVYPGVRTSEVTSEIGGTCGFTSIQVDWEESGTTLLSSINVSGQTTELTKGGSFTFGGTVTAIYSDSSERIVTSCATFSGYNLSTTGEQTVKVSFTDGVEKTITYNITVSDSGKETIYTLAAVQSGNSSYGTNYDVTIGGVTWSVPGNQNFTGFWKFGGKKSQASDPTFEATRVIYGGAITGDVDEIVIETNGVDNVNLSVSAITISVFESKANAESNTSPIASFTTSDNTSFAVNTPKSLTFTKVGTTDCAGKYYRIAFSVSNTTTSNRGLQFISATFYKNK